MFVLIAFYEQVFGRSSGTMKSVLPFLLLSLLLSSVLIADLSLLLLSKLSQMEEERVDDELDTMEIEDA